MPRTVQSKDMLQAQSSIRSTGTCAKNASIEPMIVLNIGHTSGVSATVKLNARHSQWSREHLTSFGKW